VSYGHVCLMVTCECVLWSRVSVLWSRVSDKLQSKTVRDDGIAKCLVCFLLRLQNDRQFAGILTEPIPVESIHSPNCDNLHAHTFV
jgi:hypothetical protein